MCDTLLDLVYREELEDLVTSCEEQGWTADFSHLAVGARGYVERKLLQLFKRELGFAAKEVKHLREELQKTSDKASLFLRLKRNDNRWHERAAEGEQ